MLAVLRPREGVCGGAKIFGSVCPARSVCVSSSAFFINIVFHSLHSLCDLMHFKITEIVAAAAAAAFVV